VDDTKLIHAALDGMLTSLDPHSGYLDPENFDDMRDQTRGEYGGLGIEVTSEDGVVKVISPMDGTPAFTAGVKSGDYITAVNGESVLGLSVNDAVKQMRGKPGETVTLTIAREKSDPFDVKIVREVIKPKTAVARLDGDYGVLRISGFNEKTTDEAEAAFAQIKAKNPKMKGLILDLRDNPGGLLDQAVSISDMFLEGGEIVSQRGRDPRDVERYNARPGDITGGLPMVVLINSGTASAAEIVSGALQDHDRALIVGETTFGKGLVQTVFTITENTGLALTTYHYYTPSGRLIQRNYDHVSLYDYYYVRDNENKTKDKSNLEVKLTDSGRTVYGGGGITPDEKIDNIKPNPFQENLLQHYAFFNFSKHYLATHTVAKDFEVDDNVTQQFKEFLKTNQIDYNDGDIARVNDWIKESIKSELFTSQFGQLEGLKVRAQWDPQIAKAITFLPEAQTLEDHSKLAQKTAASVPH
jgi:carboxyl-terminal processing protease